MFLIGIFLTDTVKQICNGLLFIGHVAHLHISILDTFSCQNHVLIALEEL